MASVKSQTVHAGHTIAIVMNGRQVGKVQGINVRTSFGTEGVYQLGSIMPAEHVPLRFEASLTVSKYLIKRAALAAAGITSYGEDILVKEVFDIYVIDASSPEMKVERVYEGVTQVDGNSNMQANQIVGEDATFLALNVRSGADVSIPQGVETPTTRYLASVG